jgi:hypothetical protein
LLLLILLSVLLARAVGPVHCAPAALFNTPHCLPSRAKFVLLQYQLTTPTTSCKPPHPLVFTNSAKSS